MSKDGFIVINKTPAVGTTESIISQIVGQEITPPTGNTGPEAQPGDKISRRRNVTQKYYQSHREEIRKQQAEYYKRTKETRRLKQRQRYLANREEILSRRRQIYLETNK